MAEEKNTTKSGKRLAILRIRGLVRLSKDVVHTLEMLQLHRKNYCSVHLITPSLMGMLKKVKDYVTWGEVDDAMVDALFEKRGEEYKGRLTDAAGKIKYDSRYVTHNGKKYKRFFRLHNPLGGFSRGGIKVPFTLGGVLGNRGEKMAILLKKML